MQAAPSLDLQSHELIIGEIVETYINSDCMTNRKPDVAKIDPLVYSTGAEQYQRLGEVIGQAFSLGKDGSWLNNLFNISKQSE